MYKLGPIVKPCRSYLCAAQTQWDEFLLFFSEISFVDKFYDMVSITSDALKIKPSSVIFYYCGWFDF